MAYPNFPLFFRLPKFEGKLIPWVIRECKPTKKRELLNSRECNLDFPGEVISLHVIEIY